MINVKLKSAVVTILLLVFLTGYVLAQMPVRKGPASPEEIKKAQTAVEADLNNLTAHRKYIFAMGLDNSLLAEQYNTWVKEYPKNVNIPLAIGTAYHNAEMAQAKDFLLKASEIDSLNPAIWSMLSVDAGMRGQDNLSREYIKKAIVADPSDASYAAYYVMSFRDSDPDDFKQKVFDLVKHFPESDHAARVLYWLAIGTVNINDKIKYFEQLRKLYPPQKFDWSASGMIGLADIYLQTDPEKALSLINEMGEGNDWKIRKQVAESLIRIDKLEHEQNYKLAIAELDQIKLPRFNYINNFIVLKKSSLLEKSGDVKAAYDSLAVKLARLPTDQLYSSLELYGKKTGKTKAQMNKDIETIRNSTAVPAFPFNLALYTSNHTLNLNDLKGKVVLLTFWFPGCGPCRAEFPHFEAVIDKFKGENIVYLGINVFPEQDPYVIPFMKNSRFSFIPLRGTAAFAEEHYGVKGEPENFLIDKDGKIIFKNFRIDESNHRTLELMISSLLQKD